MKKGYKRFKKKRSKNDTLTMQMKSSGMVLVSDSTTKHDSSQMAISSG